MKRTIHWQEQYTDVYPRREAVLLQSMDCLSDEVGICFRFVSTLPDFSHFLFSVNGDERESRDGELVVRVDDPHAPKISGYKVIIRAVTADGNPLREYHVDFTYYPREWYAKEKNLTSKSHLIVQYTDLIPTPTAVEDWIWKDISDDDRAFAKETWGRLLERQPSDVERVTALAKALMDELADHHGVPSDAMAGLSGLQQYRRAVAGEDEVFCSNMAAIFSHAGNTLGIPIRGIGMAHVLSTTDLYQYRIAEGHATTEVFLNDENRWIWIDLTFNCLGAFFSDAGPLNLAQFTMLLNSPGERSHLSVDEYDTSKKTTTRSPVTETFRWPSFIRFFKPEQRIVYSNE